MTVTLSEACSWIAINATHFQANIGGTQYTGSGILTLSPDSSIDVQMVMGGSGVAAGHGRYTAFTSEIQSVANPGHYLGIQTFTIP